MGEWGRKVSQMWVELLGEWKRELRKEEGLSSVSLGSLRVLSQCRMDLFRRDFTLAASSVDCPAIRLSFLSGYTPTDTLRHTACSPVRVPAIETSFLSFTSLMPRNS